ncbi:MAG: amidase [Deltaproteobacteria bacterium]|jgi:amidase|nr:amidase [Deltaproteobacteria bacterium]
MTLFRPLALIALFVFACSQEPSIDLREYDVAALQAAMESGELLSQDIVGYYLAEIARIDHAGPELRSIIEINPDALEIAAKLDEERIASGPRGPLHGIPIVLKANIDTGDQMHTTAGSLALADHRAPDDAFLVSRLRDAGAVILGKANLSEWANFRSARSSSGWSSIGGQTRNPYDPRRNPCGSSSGSAASVAANLTALSIGTETDGSIVCPAGINGIVGIKPSLGLVSRDGIIPIAHSQDTAGPLARSVTDAAILLTAISAADPSDPATASRPDGVVDYASGLSASALEGKRIGVLRSYWGAGEDPNAEAVFNQSIEVIRAAGAEIVDPIELDVAEMWEAEDEVLYYEFKADLNAYLQESGAALKTLEEIIRFNSENAASVMPFFGQEIMETAQEKGPLSEDEYRYALAESKRISQTVIDDALNENSLDAIIAPANSPAWLTDHINGDTTFGISSSSYAAVSGYPSVTVPAGFVHGLPVGLSFISGAFSEKALIDLAYAFERASRARRAPEGF